MEIASLIFTCVQNVMAFYPNDIDNDDDDDASSAADDEDNNNNADDHDNKVWKQSSHKKTDQCPPKCSKKNETLMSVATEITCWSLPYFPGCCATLPGYGDNFVKMK